MTGFPNWDVMRVLLPGSGYVRFFPKTLEPRTGPGVRFDRILRTADRTSVQSIEVRSKSRKGSNTNKPQLFLPLHVALSITAFKASLGRVSGGLPRYPGVPELTVGRDALAGLAEGLTRLSPGISADESAEVLCTGPVEICRSQLTGLNGPLKRWHIHRVCIAAMIRLVASFAAPM
ncbi:hypothetical protein DFH09DRAFT_1082327 [Mycena vulgaris]|nr:hypothetical protein DFH09DRAFT_1082327 [Mycena vulgaris]